MVVPATDTVFVLLTGPQELAVSSDDRGSSFVPSRAQGGRCLARSVCGSTVDSRGFPKLQKKTLLDLPGRGCCCPFTMAVNVTVGVPLELSAWLLVQQIQAGRIYCGCWSGRGISTIAASAKATK